MDVKEDVDVMPNSGVESWCESHLGRLDHRRWRHSGEDDEGGGDSGRKERRKKKSDTPLCTWISSADRDDVNALAVIHGQSQCRYAISHHQKYGMHGVEKCR